MEKAIITMRIVFSAGLFLMALGGFLWWHGKRLKRRCTEQTPGVVVDEGRSRRSGKGSNARKYQYNSTFSYSVLGVEYTKRISEVSYDLKFPTGQSVTVFYDPFNPQRSYVLGAGTTAAQIGVLIASSVACIILGLLIRFTGSGQIIF